MSFETVLRIKRKRTDDPLRILLTSGDPGPSGKKRRVWQLSRSSDSRGIPMPIPVLQARKDDKEQHSVESAPPRFSVRKRKPSASFADMKRQHVLDLDREEYKPEAELMSLMPDNSVLNAMLAEYLNNTSGPQQNPVTMEEDYVYDIYYPQAAAQAINETNAVLSADYGLLEHFDWDATDLLVMEEDNSNSDGNISEDSNTEDWIGNDYPDEEESSIASEDEDDVYVRGSDSENDETFDRTDWV